MEIFQFIDWVKGNQNCGLVYIRSRSQLILLGGYNQHCKHKYSDMVWAYDLNQKSKQKKWIKKCQMPLRSCYFGHVLSSDERYIILLGGYTTNKQLINTIYILDLNTIKFKKNANLSSPVSGSVRAVMGNDSNIYLLKHDLGNLWKINIQLVIEADGRNAAKIKQFVVPKLDFVDLIAKPLKVKHKQSVGRNWKTLPNTQTNAKLIELKDIIPLTLPNLALYFDWRRTQLPQAPTLLKIASTIWTYLKAAPVQQHTVSLTEATENHILEHPNAPKDTYNTPPCIVTTSPCGDLLVMIQYMKKFEDYSEKQFLLILYPHIDNVSFIGNDTIKTMKGEPCTYWEIDGFERLTHVAMDENGTIYFTNGESIYRIMKTHGYRGRYLDTYEDVFTPRNDTSFITCLWRQHKTIYFTIQDWDNEQNLDVYKVKSVRDKRVWGKAYMTPHVGRNNYGNSNGFAIKVRTFSLISSERIWQLGSMNFQKKFILAIGAAQMGHTPQLLQIGFKKKIKIFSLYGSKKAKAVWLRSAPDEFTHSIYYHQTTKSWFCILPVMKTTHKDQLFWIQFRMDKKKKKITWQRLVAIPDKLKDCVWLYYDESRDVLIGFVTSNQDTEQYVLTFLPDITKYFWIFDETNTEPIMQRDIKKKRIKNRRLEPRPPYPKTLETEQSKPEELSTVKKIFVNELQQKELVLYGFTEKDICNGIKKWIRNDINYKQFLSKTKQIISEEALTGKEMMSISAEHAKRIVELQMNYITPESLDITFNCFDKWKMEDPEAVRMATSEEIALKLFHYPIKKLLKHILDEKIDGKKFIECVTGKNVIQIHTGWKPQECYQIEAMLFKKYTPTEEEIKKNIQKMLMHKDNNKVLSIHALDRISDVILKFDVKELYYKIKNDKNIDEFSDEIVNLVDELVDNNNKQYDSLIQKVYAKIAECFIFSDVSVDYDVETLQAQKTQLNWICSNCNNYNFNSFVGNKMNMDLPVCTLCGIHQISSITMKLRNRDSFVTVNQSDDVNITDNIDQKADYIDELISTAAKHKTFDLFCPNRKDNKTCPSILRLAKMLIVYKKWLYTVYEKTNGNDSIHKTVQIDLEKLIDDKTFESVYIRKLTENEKLKQTDKELLKSLLNDITVKTFLNMKRKQFAAYVKDKTKIKPAQIGKLYSQVMKTLKTVAQQEEFGHFLNDLEMNNVNKDYYHILKVHINEGDKDSIQNCFRFFEKVVHSEDTATEILECRSVKRREERVDQLNTDDIRTDEKKQEQETDIWKLKQKYNQNQLDIIHSYLAHSDWQYFIQRYANQHNSNEDDNYDFKEHKSKDQYVQNKEKYITDLSDINSGTYGFGIEHYYPHLSPKYASVHDELIFNKLCHLSEEQFQHALVKSIKLHDIATHTEYRNVLICKYFNKEYMIIRNELIGIRHILAIIIYTDFSHFCTAFRATYRRVHGETLDDDVAERHGEYIRYARCLFESIEFFGKEMKRSLTVYHGLSKVMKFSKFTTYFNQPISTTTKLEAAQLFSQGVGIILVLKSGVNRNNYKEQVPKYLTVSFLSTFPNEDEKLFYGQNVVFNISNIYEASTMNGHQNELLMLNKFQKTLHNQTVIWNENDKNTQKMINALQTLIKDQQTANANVNIDEFKEDEKDTLYSSKYGRDLFDYFCNNSNTKSVEIKQFTSLPVQLKNALFFRDGI
eukprot:199855_1